MLTTCHFFNRICFKNDAVDEFEPQHGPLVRASVRDHPAAAVFKVKHLVGDDLPRKGFVHKPFACGIHIDVAAVVVQQSAAPEGQKLQAEAVGHRGAHGLCDVQNLRRCSVPNGTVRIGSRMHFGRQARINSCAAFTVCRKAPGSDHQAFRNIGLRYCFAAGRFLHSHEPVARRASFKAHHLIVQSECGTGVSHASRHGKHVAAACGVAGHRKASRMQT